ncbi:NlpC/P60 family protein [Desulfoluna sp.]|uniref:NlpC/P60 family protein n=1 Tax=Desulfoluna sp. TaxID=2045199 RepID=UPI00260DF87A|nr:NlpC/P60 family protein [Desulfoluna sp.]
MKTWILCILIFSLLGCATVPREKHRRTIKIKHPSVVNLTDTARVKARLNAQYAEWKGTRYKMGGTSKRGVDCSGFVHLTYRDTLGITIPRTTKLLAKTGKPVKRKDLRIGDLVLFKTGLTVRHVGIYMGNNIFLHASTNEGVTLTNLNQPYWKKRYWKARRVWD